MNIMMKKEKGRRVKRENKKLTKMNQQTRSLSIPLPRLRNREL
jgi:hypothetical protein